MERHETGSKTPKEKEIKYFVLKLDDIHNKLTSEEENTLYKLADKIGRARVIEGKPYSNRYIVVNEEEPYAKKVWDMILGCDLPCFRNYDIRDEKCHKCQLTQECFDERYGKGPKNLPGECSR